MRYLLLLCVCLALLGCARTTNFPGKNLDGVPGQATHMLVLSSVPEDKRGAATDRFLDELSGRHGTMSLAIGPQVPQGEVERVEAHLLARGVKPANIWKKNLVEGASLSLVFAEADSMAPELDKYWFSMAAVSEDFGRATNYNMAASVIHKEELTQPGILGHPNPQGVVGPVERYQSGQINVSQGKSSASSSSGSGNSSSSSQ